MIKLGLLILSFFALPNFSWADDGFVDEEYINYRISEEPLERLAPYRERRLETGEFLSFSYSQFQPHNYKPQYTVLSWDQVYKGPMNGVIEVTAAYKLNFFLGSLSLGLGVGIQNTQSVNVNVVNSTLTLVPIRLEGIFALDSLFANPGLVPYGIGGVYSVLFRETQASLSYTGTTQAAPYFGGGLMIRLDTFFPEESFNAYKENYQENTFVYLEARKFMTSSNIQDPDFGSDLQYGAGVRFEF